MHGCPWGLQGNSLAADLAAPQSTNGRAIFPADRNAKNLDGLHLVQERERATRFSRPPQQDISG